MGEARRRTLAILQGRAPTTTHGRALTIEHRRHERFGDEFAAWLIAAKKDMARDALAAQGLRAFDCSREGAAIHEAGHTVVGAALGENIAGVEIYPAISDSRQWGGITRYGRGNVFKFPGENTQADLECAARQIAGFAAERLFDEDFREGSSLKERAIFGYIIGHVAQRLGKPPEQLGERIITLVSEHLEKHRAIHHEIASRLLARDALHRGELALLLEPVERMNIAIGVIVT